MAGRPTATQVRMRAESLHNLVFERGLSPAQTVREFEKAVNETMISTMWYWFFQILPRNFAPYAGNSRGYPPASKGYSFYKWKLTQRDSMSRPHFVFSGPAVKANPARGIPHNPNWRDLITSLPMSPPRMRRTAYGYVGEIVVHVPDYVRRNRSVPDMARLATYLTRRDYQEMDAFFDATLSGLLGYGTVAGRAA